MSKNRPNHGNGNRSQPPGAQRQGGGGRPNFQARPEFSGPIPSPYNFVPLNDQVVFPEWSHLVSQDVPFKDGLSGHIDLEIEAVTPIYVRNGGDHPQNRQGDDYTDFFRLSPGGPYAIPGTSIKGMLRNVVEIVTQGKMRTGDKRYAVRDLNNPDRDLYGNWMTTPQPPHRSKPKAGWLKLDEKGDWRLYPCEFVRVERSDLLTYFRNSFPGQTIPSLHTRQDSVQKRNAWGETRLVLGFSFNPRHTHKTSGPRPVLLEYPKVTSLQGVGSGASNEGTIVFTGQPMADTVPKHSPGNKHLEFIFYNPRKESIKVPNSIKKDFIFIHSNDERNPDGMPTPNKEWSYWSGKLKQGERVPVFYLAFKEANPTPQSTPVEATDNGAKLHSMGLALMYRLAYKWRTKDLLERVGKNAPHYSDQMDFAETLFGRIHDDEALKGRVQIEPAIISNGKQPGNTTTVVLNSPKPSFYPNYIRQDSKSIGVVNGNYKTYMDDDSSLRGWKRYPVRANASVPRREGGNNNITTSFRPLPTTTKFKGRIHCHNLLPIEAGGLLWSLTLGEGRDLCHSLGMAKPYGFGAIRVTVKSTLLEPGASSPEPIPEEELIQHFVNYIVKKMGYNNSEGWLSSAYMREFLAMANRQHAARAALEYPPLGSPKSGGSFAWHKKNKHILPWYSELAMNQSAAISAPKTVSPVETAIVEKLERIQADQQAKAPFERGTVVENTETEKRRNKSGKEAWWIHFTCAGKSFSGTLTPEAKNALPKDFSGEQRYRFKIVSFSKANPAENITLDFADSPPVRLT
jgi:CRISPR-associated protein (TIGR03986 family)